MGSVQNKESALGGLQPELLSLIPLVKSCFLTSRPILFVRPILHGKANLSRNWLIPVRDNSKVVIQTNTARAFKTTGTISPLCLTVALWRALRQHLPSSFSSRFVAVHTLVFFYI